MCMEDILIGRFSRAYTVSTVLSNTVGVQIVPVDNDRLSIVLGSPTAGTMFWSTDPGVGVLTGIPLPSGLGPVTLNVKDHGELVTGALFGIASAGTPSVTAAMASFHSREFIRQQGKIG